MRKLYCLFALVLCCSCARVSEMVSENDNIGEDSTIWIEVVSVEDALSTLDAFLIDNDMIQTKSGHNRAYSTVSTYYRDGVLTKSLSGEELPTAYVVNFDDNEGFAVLGANTAVPDVIAVTESGTINPETLEVITPRDSVECQSLFYDMDDSEIEYFNNHVIITPDSLFYSAEDEDYYVGSLNSDDMATALIHQCIGVAYDRVLEGENGTGIGSGSGTGSGSGSGTVVQYNTKSPLLTYSWGQRSPYNRYCRRGLFKDKPALTGCSSTAMAMIVAYNEFPQSLTINGSTINYSGITSGATIDYVDKPYKDQIALLMGSIYNFVTKVATSGFTLITPRQIKIRMQEFGYSNVVKTDASSLTTPMISQISTMLGADKPVFISAIPRGLCNWDSGHSWVVDGAKYSANNTYLLHMNFGWNGKSNGYYATGSINPARAAEYDNPSWVNSKADYYYGWNFRIITYDVPTTRLEYTINYTY